MIKRHALIGLALLVITVDGCIVIFRVIGLPHVTAMYAGVLMFTLIATFIARRYFKPRDHEETHTMAKRQLLPPPTDSQKREVSVNLRFSAEVYERLKAIAEFSNTGVASLLFYVTVNTTLPMMEKEMQKVRGTPSANNRKAAVAATPDTPSVVTPPKEE